MTIERLLSSAKLVLEVALVHPGRQWGTGLITELAGVGCVQNRASPRMPDNSPMPREAEAARQSMNMRNILRRNNRRLRRELLRRVHVRDVMV